MLQQQIAIDQEKRWNELSEQPQQYLKFHTLKKGTNLEDACFGHDRDESNGRGKDRGVDQGRYEKWDMKLTKEVANPRCLSYSICNPAVFSLSTKTRQRVLALRVPRQEGMERRLRDGGRGVTWKLYLGLAFTILTLERVTIRCCEVNGGGGGEVFGGGGGEVFGGSVVFSGDGVGNEVRGVVFGVTCGVVCGGVC
nr:hypothetical protein [Tanacetum cinerariifolium]